MLEMFEKGESDRLDFVAWSSKPVGSSRAMWKGWGVWFHPVLDVGWPWANCRTVGK